MRSLTPGQRAIAKRVLQSAGRGESGMRFNAHTLLELSLRFGRGTPEKLDSKQLTTALTLLENHALGGRGGRWKRGLMLAALVKTPGFSGLSRRMQARSFKNCMNPPPGRVITMRGGKAYLSRAIKARAKRNVGFLVGDVRGARVRAYAKPMRAAAKQLDRAIAAMKKAGHDVSALKSSILGGRSVSDIAASTDAKQILGKLKASARTFDLLLRRSVVAKTAKKTGKATTEDSTEVIRTATRQLAAAVNSTGNQSLTKVAGKLDAASRSYIRTQDRKLQKAFVRDIYDSFRANGAKISRSQARKLAKQLKSVGGVKSAPGQMLLGFLFPGLKAKKIVDKLKKWGYVQLGVDALNLAWSGINWSGSLLTTSAGTSTAFGAAVGAAGVAASAASMIFGMVAFLHSNGVYSAQMEQRAQIRGRMQGLVFMMKELKKGFLTDPRQNKDAIIGRPVKLRGLSFYNQENVGRYKQMVKVYDEMMKLKKTLKAKGKGHLFRKTAMEVGRAFFKAGRIVYPNGIANGLVRRIGVPPYRIAGITIK